MSSLKYNDVVEAHGYGIKWKEWCRAGLHRRRIVPDEDLRGQNIVLLQISVLCEMLNITTEMVSTPLSYCTVSDTTLALLHSKGKGIFFIHTYS